MLPAQFAIGLRLRDCVFVIALCFRICVCVLWCECVCVSGQRGREEDEDELEDGADALSSYDPFHTGTYRGIRIHKNRATTTTTTTTTTVASSEGADPAEKVC